MINKNYIDKSYIAFAFLGIVWGTNFIFMRWSSEFITPVQIVFLRVLCGFIPILLFACYKKALRAAHLRYVHHFLVMAILATVLYYWAFAAGTSLLLSGVSGVLSGCIPLFSFITALLFLRQEKLTLRKSAGVLLGLAGVILISRPWEASGQAISYTGVGYMVLGACSVGCSFVYARKYLSPLNIPALALTTYQIGLSLVILTLLTPFTGLSAITASVKASLGLILGLGLLGTGLAYLTYYFLIARLGAVAAASVSYIPPVVALLCGYFFADEPLGMLEIGSMVLIFSGVILLQSRKQGE